MGRRFTVLNLAAVAVGAVAGLAAVGLRYAISWVQRVAFQGDAGAATPREENTFVVSRWGWLVILVPALGGLAIAAIRRYWPAIRQHGVTEVMAAVQAKGGILRARSSVGHALLSAITVGTGGSTGREGPIGYIGATLGSSVARRLGLTPRDIKILLGCGFSAGIAASFNAPLGAVLMALELIVPEFSTHAFIPLVGATVVGVTIGNMLLAGHATFAVPAFVFHSSWELILYVVVGIVCGFAAVAFIRLIAWTYYAWAKSRMADFAKPVLGGLLVGILGFTMFWATSRSSTMHDYHVFGTGYATMTNVLATPADAYAPLLPILAILVLAKPIATAITIGSGGAGGMFSVSLYQGALWGGLIGIAGHAIAPSIVVNPASYALVGMGAFYAASTRATLTAIVMITELTRDYAIVAPLMLAAVTADAVSVRLSKETVYTLKLTQTGVIYEHDRVQSPLDFLVVRDVMTKEVHGLPSDLSVGEAFNRMIDLGHTGYPVLGPDGKLKGVVTRRDLSKQLHAGKGAESLGNVISGLTITALAGETLYRARDRLHREGIGRLVVVDAVDRTQIVGILTRSDLLRAEAERGVEHEDEWS
ncbi:MAG: chloride channel protein [bacterium]